MLSVKFIRENLDLVKETIERRKDKDMMQALNLLLKKDEDWRSLKKNVDELRHRRNEVSMRINELKKQGKDVSALIAEAKTLPKQIKELEDKMDVLDSEIKNLLRKIPNIMHPAVPYGESDKDNVVIKEWGTKRKFNFPVRNHVEILEKWGLADFDASARVSGRGFYFLKGDLAKLNQALIAYARDFMESKGYLYVEPPLMIERRVIEAALDLTNIQQSIYEIKDSNLCLIGTSEHALLGMHDHQILDEKDLPLKYYSYSMCFRKEIGSHGINEKGLWRTHQFNKVEQFIYCTKEQSWDMFFELLQNSEEILQGLELPYRVIEICTGDLGIWKARSMDLEVWRPTINDYGEVMSLSNCTDYQARDLEIKVRRKDGTLEYVHTLNDTALATSRIMVAIIENYQNEDGTITVPKALRKYMNGQEVIPAKN
ncbi:MAG: seryl-tRNA synthetase [Candidatus Woesearchaeota archaeon]|nr:seryl-tRNA synthetase [Candidatus Woesearchaeota archaeon]